MTAIDVTHIYKGKHQKVVRLAGGDYAIGDRGFTHLIGASPRQTSWKSAKDFVIGIIASKHALDHGLMALSPRTRDQVRDVCHVLKIAGKA